MELASKDTWRETDAKTAEAYLDLVWEHPVTCDGLALYIERLPAGIQAALLNKMEDLRRQGTTLLEYRKERL